MPLLPKVRRFLLVPTATWFISLSSLHCASRSRTLATAAFAASAPLPPMTSSTTKSPSLEEALPLAKQAMQYLDDSTDPFHAVKTSADWLAQKGFAELSPTQAFAFQNIQPGGKYYYTKNKSTLVAFTVGPKYQPGTPACFSIIGGHTDSPNLRVKPRSIRKAANCRLIGVETYGGGLWHTWFDRDLGLSGRVWVRQGGNDDDNNNKVASRLVQIRRPILRISNLAIHLQTAKEREAFAVNKEDHLSPILATEAQQALMQPIQAPVAAEASTTDASTPTVTAATGDGWQEHQEPALLHILATELQCKVTDLVDFELSLFDVQTASLGGAFQEFLYSARLDNLASCFLAVQGLLDYCESKEFTESSAISMICLYDHEEVGSSSAVGAASPVLSEAVPRLLASLNGGTPVSPDVIATSLAQSLVLSSDQAHAIHPNYASKHEKAHQPHMNSGMVIKRNTNQRYATTPWTGVVMREIARQAGLPAPQEFIVRQDCGCGSTIGPIISTQTGIAAIDMGCPQLSMHSIREIMGVVDLKFGVRLFDAFFRLYPSVRAAVEN